MLLLCFSFSFLILTLFSGNKAKSESLNHGEGQAKLNSYVLSWDKFKGILLEDESKNSFFLKVSHILTQAGSGSSLESGKSEGVCSQFGVLCKSFWLEFLAILTPDFP